MSNVAGCVLVDYTVEVAGLLLALIMSSGAHRVTADGTLTWRVPFIHGTYVGMECTRATSQELLLMSFAGVKCVVLISKFVPIWRTAITMLG